MKVAPWLMPQVQILVISWFVDCAFSDAPGTDLVHLVICGLHYNRCPRYRSWPSRSLWVALFQMPQVQILFILWDKGCAVADAPGTDDLSHLVICGYSIADSPSTDLGHLVFCDGAFSDTQLQTLVIGIYVAL
jgi:hypothetical protein